MTLAVQGHLGGYVPGGDPASWYPDLFLWLINEMEVKSIIDVGCAEGRVLDFFAEHDVSVSGVEGIAQDHLDIIQHDYTAGPWPVPGQKIGRREVDLVWSCEFVEHVEEQFVPNFLETFRLGRMVMMTHALPGQPGYHHVNCRDDEYWVGRMIAIGYDIDNELTAQTRELARANDHPDNYYARSGLVFRREEE